MTSDRDSRNGTGHETGTAEGVATPPKRGRERLNLEEIARLSGVSRSTVSRVINDDPRVSNGVRARVQEIIAAHDYVPNAAARSLASRRTGIIGLLIPRAIESVFGDRFFQLIIKSIATTANRTEQQLMLLLELHEHVDSAQRLFNRVIAGRHLDGIVVVSNEVDEPLVELLDRYHFPFVLVGRHPTLQASFIDVENQLSARLAVEHLLGHGHKRIAMIGGSANLIAGIDRRAGYMQALSAAGLPVDPDLYRAANFNEHEAYLAAHELMDVSDRPTAIFVASDSMAVSALRAIEERGLRVPEDIALFGFDGSEVAAAANPPISTVSQPIFGLGQEAVVMLQERINAPDAPPMHRLLPTELLLRASCGCGSADLTGQGVSGA